MSDTMHTYAPVALAATLACVGLAPQCAGAQDYPAKPVRMIVPYAPGGSVDITAQRTAAELTRNLGRQFVVDYRAGAGGNIGAEMVAKSGPDGYTVLVTTSTIQGLGKFLYTKLTYDPNGDLLPVIVLTSQANVLVVRPSLPVNSVKELIALARAQPGKLTFASAGAGSSIHMSGEMFKQALGVDILHVPFKGSGPAQLDMIGGRVDMMFDNIPGVIAQIRAEKLRALATTGAKRDEALPNLPTMIESGVPGYEVTTWVGLMVPAGTPRDIIAKLNAAGQKATQSSEFISRMKDLGYTIVGGTAEHMGELIRDEIRRWGPVVKAAGVTLD